MTGKSSKAALVGLIVGPIGGVLGTFIKVVIVEIALAIKGVSTQGYMFIFPCLFAGIIGAPIGIVVGILNVEFDYGRGAPLVWAVVAGFGAEFGRLGEFGNSR